MSKFPSPLIGFLTNLGSCEFCPRAPIGSVESASVSALWLCAKCSEGVSDFVLWDAR